MSSENHIRNISLGDDSSDKFVRSLSSHLDMADLAVHEPEDPKEYGKLYVSVHFHQAVSESMV